MLHPIADKPHPIADLIANVICIVGMFCFASITILLVIAIYLGSSL